MKNRRLERFRRMAQQYHRNKRGDQFDDGVLVRHAYDGIDPDALSWWDDLAFIQGDRRVNVAWQHPRHVFQESIVAAALEAAEPFRKEEEGGLFGSSSKIYKKVGRSRKKVRYYTHEPSPDRQVWLEAVRREEARLSQEAEFAVQPSIKVEWLNWCRFVNIVAPVEVRNVPELKKLAALVRLLLKGETTLKREFPGYCYGRKQWMDEGLADQALRIVSHRVLTN